jgi:hypothetical protein
MRGCCMSAVRSLRRDCLLIEECSSIIDGANVYNLMKGMREDCVYRLKVLVLGDKGLPFLMQASARPRSSSPSYADIHQTPHSYRPSRTSTSTPKGNNTHSNAPRENSSITHHDTNAASISGTSAQPATLVIPSPTSASNASMRTQ